MQEKTQISCSWNSTLLNTALHYKYYHCGKEQSSAEYEELKCRAKYLHSPLPPQDHAFCWGSRVRVVLLARFPPSCVMRAISSVVPLRHPHSLNQKNLPPPFSSSRGAEVDFGNTPFIHFMHGDNKPGVINVLHTDSLYIQDDIFGGYQDITGYHRLSTGMCTGHLFAIYSPVDAIWWETFWSTLVQILAFRLAISGVNDGIVK